MKSSMIVRPEFAGAGGVLLRLKLRTDSIEPQSKVLSQKILAGPGGVEPPSKVLETSILPLNYGPI